MLRTFRHFDQFICTDWIINFIIIAGINYVFVNVYIIEVAIETSSSLYRVFNLSIHKLFAHLYQNSLPIFYSLTICYREFSHCGIIMKSLNLGVMVDQ